MGGGGGEVESSNSCFGAICVVLESCDTGVPADCMIDACEAMDPFGVWPLGVCMEEMSGLTLSHTAMSSRSFPVDELGVWERGV